LPRDHDGRAGDLEDLGGDLEQVGWRVLDRFDGQPEQPSGHRGGDGRLTHRTVQPLGVAAFLSGQAERMCPSMAAIATTAASTTSGRPHTATTSAVPSLSVAASSATL
jgi:hypothetical protein